MAPISTPHLPRVFCREGFGPQLRDAVEQDDREEFKKHLEEVTNKSQHQLTLYFIAGEALRLSLTPDEQTTMM